MPEDYGEATFTPIRNSGQLYVPTAVAQNPRLGFSPGDDVRFRVLECGLLIAWRAGDLPTDELAVPPPDPARLPWPLTSTGATYDDLANPDGDDADDEDTHATVDTTDGDTHSTDAPTPN
ncbi:hypothetical protein [Halorubellus sp. PRR65]|uniref:hypothetical protein n=1 Tax=Halorubellus sp. PRR65 TaxID=3098148 RepID=UPI002B257B4C|nr:hypothetical protein [Halorubellus sp. PRR65]